jgi:hypothetical protein
MRLGGPHSRSCLPGIIPRFVGRPARSRRFTDWDIPTACKGYEASNIELIVTSQNLPTETAGNPKTFSPDITHSVLFMELTLLITADPPHST